MSSLLKKMRGDKKGWYKVSDLRPGLQIAVPSERSQTSNSDPRSLTSKSDILWDEIVSIKPVGKEQVFDIEVEGTHNFVGNDIFAHNTYILKAGDLTADAPPEVLTANNTGVDLAKLATHTLADVQELAAQFAAEDTKMVSLETRVTALESGAISTDSGTSSSFSTSTITNAFNSLGVLIQKGIAQFNTLVFRQLVASKDADGTSSAGSISVLTGNTVAQVTNSLVVPSTKIFVTFNSQITGSWWVSDKAVGSFRVVLSAPQAADVSFDYFLVQTEGALATSTPDGIFGSQTSNASSGGLTSPDHTPPVITLLGDNPIHLSIGGTFVEPGLSITDENQTTTTTYINGIQQKVSASTIDTSSQTTYIITYSVADSAGNNATATRSVIVGSPAPDSETPTSEPETPAPDSSDVIPPVVTLVGDAAMQINVNDSFTDPGATAADPSTGSGQATDLTAGIVVTGAVDTATEGLYTLTYTVTDAAGNTASVSRVVTVVATPITP